MARDRCCYPDRASFCLVDFELATTAAHPFTTPTKSRVL